MLEYLKNQKAINYINQIKLCPIIYSLFYCTLLIPIYTLLICTGYNSTINSFSFSTSDVVFQSNWHLSIKVSSFNQSVICFPPFVTSILFLRRLFSIRYKYPRLSFNRQIYLLTQGYQDTYSVLTLVQLMLKVWAIQNIGCVSSMLLQGLHGATSYLQKELLHKRCWIWLTCWRRDIKFWWNFYDVMVQEKTLKQGL